MREVIPGILWIGNAGDACNVPCILGLGITAVIDLALEGPPQKYPREMVYCRFPLLDGSGNATAVLRGAIDVLALFISVSVPTLVFCGAGMSRSPAVVAAALGKVRNEPPRDVLRDILLATSHDVSPALWQEIESAATDQMKD
jgi:protein-tyrosine phosphatase